MRDTKDIAEEFSRWTWHPNPPRPLQTYWYDTDAMLQEIARLRTRVAWLENEIDHIDGIASAAINLMNAPLDEREPEIRKVISAARIYIERSLPDDGIEP